MIPLQQNLAGCPFTVVWPVVQQDNWMNGCGAKCPLPSNHLHRWQPAASISTLLCARSGRLIWSLPTDWKICVRHLACRRFAAGSVCAIRGKRGEPDVGPSQTFRFFNYYTANVSTLHHFWDMIATYLKYDGGRCFLLQFITNKTLIFLSLTNCTALLSLFQPLPISLIPTIPFSLAGIPFHRLLARTPSCCRTLLVVHASAGSRSC